jgi:hypothetical protein
MLVTSNPMGAGSTGGRTEVAGRQDGCVVALPSAHVVRA